jgi:hypothetical protein
MRPLILAAFTIVVLGCGGVPSPSAAAPEPTAVGLPVPPPSAAMPAAEPSSCGCATPAPAAPSGPYP